MTKAIDQKLFPMPDEEVMVLYDERELPFVYMSEKEIEFLLGKFEKEDLSLEARKNVLLVHCAISEVTSWKHNGCKTSLQELARLSCVEADKIVWCIEWLEEIKLVQGVLRKQLDGSEQLIVYALRVPAEARQ